MLIGIDSPANLYTIHTYESEVIDSCTAGLNTPKLIDTPELITPFIFKSVQIFQMLIFLFSFPARNVQKPWCCVFNLVNFRQKCSQLKLIIHCLAKK